MIDSAVTFSRFFSLAVLQVRTLILLIADVDALAIIIILICSFHHAVRQQIHLGGWPLSQQLGSGHANSKGSRVTLTRRKPARK